jgi:hypothetical protein
MEDKAIGTPFPAERVAVMSGTSSALRPIISRRVYFQRCSGGSRHQKGSARAFSTWAGLIRRLARQVEGKGSLLFVTMAERVGDSPKHPPATDVYSMLLILVNIITRLDQGGVRKKPCNGFVTGSKVGP